MRNGKWICLLIIELMFSTAGAIDSGDNFEKKLNEGIKGLYDLGDSDVEIEIRSNRRDFASFNFDSMQIEPLTRSEPRGLLSFNIILFEKDKAVKSGQMRVKIAYFENVLVTIDRIGRHQPVTPDKYVVERMEITSLTSRPLTLDDSLADFWTKRDIRKGQILSSSSVEKIPTILSGQGVSILYRSATLEISSRGIALESGHIGDRIRIKNGQSQKVITCTVRDKETVEVAAN